MRSRTEHRRDSIHSLAAAVERLSRMLTKDRDHLPEAYLNDSELRQAYLRYFLPVNRAKIGIPLGELCGHPARLLERERLRVLDIGCGPGTAILGIMDFFGTRSKRPALEFTALDAVPGNLSEAERLFREAARRYPTATLRTFVRTIGTAADRFEGAYELVILSNVLNELHRDEPERTARRVDTLARLMETAVTPEGSCIIIEPSLRETSRDLLSVRDELARAGCTLYSPCLTQKPCPALLNPQDWCHEDRPWEPPQLIREIDSLIGLRKDSLKFSYLVVRRDKRSLAECFPDEAFRVVSEPLVTKGKRELFLCNRGGRRMVMRQDKDKAPGNSFFDELTRGDVARFEGLIDEGKRLRVAKDTRVLR